MNGTEICKINENLKAARSLWDSLWMDVADNIVFRKTSIHGETTSGEKKTQKMYDSTATLAAQDLAAWINGNMLSGEWFSLKMGGVLEEVKDYQEWLEDGRKKLLAAFRDSNFYGQINEVLLDLVEFCTGALFVEENEIKRPGFNGFNFISLSPGTYCVILGRDGRAKGVFRELRLEAHEAIERFGENTVSDEIKKSAMKDPAALHPFVHACFPKEMFGGKHKTQKPYVSYYVDAKKKTIMSTGGFNWFPFFVIPWLRESGENYGRGPGITSLPDVKTAHRAQELSLKEWAISIWPPLKVHDQGVIGSVNLQAGGITVVAKSGADENLKPIYTGARYSDNRLRMEDLKEGIKEIFHGDKVKFIPPRQETGQMTAYEVARRYQLAQLLLGPTFGNLVDHGFDPLVEVGFNMMLAGGAFTPPPGGLRKMLEQTGGKVRVEYESPIARATKMQTVEAIVNTVEMSGKLVEMQPDILDNFKLDDAVVEAAKAYGFPTKLINSDEERKVIRDARAQRQKEQEDIEKLGGIAKAGKDMAGAVKELPADLMGGGA